MSLLNKASLIQIPSGYKDGTLYSAKPTNGDGDFTFSRGSNLAATRVNSDGLIEKGRENLLLQSNQFDTTWTQSNVSVTSGQSGYDGSSDAWQLSVSASSYYMTQNLVTSNVQTFSVYAKAGTLNWLILGMGGGPFTQASFDLQNGVLGTTTNAIGSNIESIGNGWYRCSLIINKTTTNRTIYPAIDDNDFSASSGYIYIQDSQTEVGLVATDYIETGASTAQAGILEDMPRLDYSGGATCGSLLLEPQRSNLLAYSEDFTTRGGIWQTFGNLTKTLFAATSPDGYDTAAHITGLNGDGTNDFRYALSYNSANKTLTYSIYLKGSGTLRLQMSNGVDQAHNKDITLTSDWKRHSVSGTFNSTSVSTFYLVIDDYINKTATEYYVWGAMLEEGSYATSYIPTYGASVTRGVDDAVATHTISDTETLTYYTEFIAPEQTSGGGEHLLENSSGSSRVRIYQNNSTSIRIRTDSPSANFDYSYSSLGIDVGDTVKVALSVDSGVMTAFINGVKKNTFSSATINFARLHLRPQTIITYNTGIIFNSALSDDECIQLTTL